MCSVGWVVEVPVGLRENVYAIRPETSEENRRIHRSPGFDGFNQIADFMARWIIYLLLNSWITTSIKSSWIFPQSYSVFWLQFYISGVYIIY